MPDPGDRGERSTVHLLLVDSFVPGVLCHGPRKRAKGAPGGWEGGGGTNGLSIQRHSVFSSRIYIMDLPRTTSEIESLHGCADCWKSVSEFYYPFALCERAYFPRRELCAACGGCQQMLVGTFGKNIGLHYQRYTLSNATKIISLVPFGANVCVTDDISRNSLENRRISCISQIISSSLSTFLNYLLSCV